MAGQQVGEIAAVSKHDRSDLDRRWLLEQRAIVNKGMILAVLAAGINASGQVVEEALVQGTAGKLLTQLATINAG